MPLQTMPLKFRVWDNGGFITRNGNTDLEMRDIFNSLGRMMYLYDEWEISQNTGLKDMNGDSIYTGDILKWNGEYGWVEYRDGLLLLRVQTDYEGVSTTVQTELAYMNQLAEVVGNIWQNPELLEER